MKEATDAGFPPLGAFGMLSPGMLSMFVKKEVVMRESLDFITPMELQVIYTTVSAANNCEMCLSFHSLGLLGGKAISEGDLAVLVSGGIPRTENLEGGNGRLRDIVIAAKYTIAHKGILLPREKKHLERLGFGATELAEIVFCCGHIHANNMLFVSLIENNCPVEEMLRRPVGPFAATSDSSWYGE